MPIAITTISQEALNQEVQANCLLLLDDRDNCLVACRSIPANSVVDIDQLPVLIINSIELAHKVARTNIACGDKIFKYGAVIGSATLSINKGEHIHLHNMQSDYLPTFIIPTRSEIQER